MHSRGDLKRPALILSVPHQCLINACLLAGGRLVVCSAWLVGECGLVGCLVGSLVGGRMVDWWVGGLVGWWIASLVFGELAGCLVGWLVGRILLGAATHKSIIRKMTFNS